jgi:hypothetical protein
MAKSLHFFLGGHDLEMMEIARLARAANLPCDDKGLGWGARLSAYQREIETAVSAGRTAVGVELGDDTPPDWPARRKLILADHHGGRAGGPSSLRQVFALLELPSEAWTRRLTLIEANDVDHIRGLLRAGATLDEAAMIRAEDRAAQGITRAEEAEGVVAAAAAHRLCGTLLAVELPHKHIAAALDPLALAAHPALLEAIVICPGETAFVGRGVAVEALDRAFPGGWTGGNLPANGFWGHDGAGGAPPGETAVLAVLRPLVQNG